MSCAEPHDLLHCTFCTKSAQLVKKLIAGPGVYICDECIGLCIGILDDLASDLLAQLSIASSRTDALVEQLRADGVPWDDIAEALRRDGGESS